MLVKAKTMHVSRKWAGGLDLQKIVCLIQLSLDNSLLTALSAGKLLLDDGGRRLTVSAA